jgi:hypothetical protein
MAQDSHPTNYMEDIGGTKTGVLSDDPSIILDALLGRCVYPRCDTCICDPFRELMSCVLVGLCALIRLDAGHDIHWKGILEGFRRVDAVSVRPVEATGT